MEKSKAIVVLFLYFNLCLSVKLDGLQCSLTSIHFLTNNIISSFDTLCYYFPYSHIKIMHYWWFMYTSGAETAYPSGAPVFTPRFLVRFVLLDLWFMYMLCRSLFVLLYFWPLCCLFFFDLRILITPLVSSNSS